MSVVTLAIVAILLAIHLVGQYLVIVSQRMKKDGYYLRVLLFGKALIFLSNFFTLCTLLELIIKK